MCKGGRVKVNNSLSSKQIAAVVTKDSNSSSWRCPTDWSKVSPSSVPSKGEIKAAIPKECFERSAIHSFVYVLRDFAMAAGLVFVTSHLLSTELPSSSLLDKDTWIWFLGWNTYAFWQGCILTGIWVRV